MSKPIIGFINKGCYGMFFAIWRKSDVSGVSPSSEQTLDQHKFDIVSFLVVGEV